MNSNDTAAINQNRPDPASGRPGFRRMRWWMPAAMLLLAAASIVLIRHPGELDSNFKNMQTSLAGAITILLLLVWFLCFTRLRWRARFIGLLLFAAGVFGLRQTFRFDGSIDGSGNPRIVWRWTPKRDGNIGAFKPASITAGQPAVVASADCPAYLGSERQGVIKGIELERDWSAHPPQEL